MSHRLSFTWRSSRNTFRTISGHVQRKWKHIFDLSWSCTLEEWSKNVLIGAFDKTETVVKCNKILCQWITSGIGYFRRSIRLKANVLIVLCNFLHLRQTYLQPNSAKSLHAVVLCYIFRIILNICKPVSAFLKTIRTNSKTQWITCKSS